MATDRAIPIPESWTQIVADAVPATEQLELALGDIADLKTKTTTRYLAPAKVAPLVPGKLPEANVHERLTETALSATFVRFVDQTTCSPMAT
ncbi:MULTISPECIES: hypothetical protein [unclassified Microbacterium]|uniref:hypothetical protein n=1 Tax=unclassified Microbacterium TaxID=2609290 RepID=UPI003018E31A